MDDDEGCLKKLYLKHYQEFNEDIQCLASLQLACVSFFEYDIGCKIAPDLLAKEGLQDWMVTNVAYCQMAKSTLVDTEVTIDQGLSLRKEHGADYLLGMKSMLEAGRGNVEQAEALLNMREEQMNDGASHVGFLSEMLIASLKDDTTTQKEKWQKFTAGAPEWQSKNYYKKLVDHCKQSAKQHGKKLAAKGSIWGWLMSSNKIFWIGIIIYVVYRVMNRE